MEKPHPQLNGPRNTARVKEINPTQGATQHSEGWESPSQKKGVTQQSVGSESISPTEACTLQSMG